MSLPPITEELAHTLSIIAKLRETLEAEGEAGYGPLHREVDVSRLDPEKSTVVLDMDETMLSAVCDYDSNYYVRKEP